MRKGSILLVCILLCSVFAFAASDLQKVIEGLPERGDGAFLRKYPNGFRIFGVGTAVVDDKDDAEALLRSEQIASMAARKALSEYVSQTLSANTELSKAFQKAEKVDEVEGEKSREYHKTSLQDFSQEMKSGTDNIMRGVVTVKTIQFEKNGHLMSRVLVAYSSKTLNILQAAQEAGGAIADEGGVNIPAGDSTIQAPEEKKEEWLLCIGRGASRDLAVKAAVIEGIQQVYGAYIQSNETYKKRFAQLEASGNLAVEAEGSSKGSIAGISVAAEGKANASSKADLNMKSSSLEQSTDILSRTKGFVEAYRIVSVVEVASGLEATIKAKFVNPRAGGLKAVMVCPMGMPLSKRTNVYEVAPKKRISGAELSSLCQRQFERAFSNANKYMILNQADIADAVKQNKMTLEMEQANLVSPAELSKIGKMLTADLVVTTQFSDIKYSRKMGLNKATKKLENLERVVFSFDYAIIEVTTGETRKQNTIQVIVPNEAIKDLRASDDQMTDEEISNKIFDLVMGAAVEKLSQDAKL